jgi:poly(A) polymerase
VITLVARHMKFMDVNHMKESTLRKFVASSVFDDELELHRVDCLSCHGKLDHYVFCKDYREQFKNEPVLPPPLITGKEIMRLGIPPGPEVGVWKDRAFEQQLEEPGWDYTQLLQWMTQRIQAGSS